MVTHDEEFAREYGDRIIELKDGNIISDQKNYAQHVANETFFEENEKYKSVIKIRKGSQLTQQIINHINIILEKEEQDIYIALTEDKDYIKSYVPELDNVKDVRPYNVLDEIDDDHEKFKIIKSSLPLKNAFKLAFSSLFTKKIKLIFMTFLFVASLVFVGIASNFSFYDVATASSLTFKKAEIKTVPLSKYGQRCEVWENKKHCFEQQISFEEEDIQKLSDAHPNINFITSLNVYYNIWDFVKINEQHPEFNQFYAYEINKVSFIQEDKSYNFDIIYGSTVKNNGEVLITDHLAESLLYFEAFPTVSTIEDFVGISFNYFDNELKIVGIVDTDYENFEYLKNTTNDSSFYNSGFNEKKQSVYQQLFMTKETYVSTLQLQQTSIHIKVGFGQADGLEAVASKSVFNDILVGNSRLPEDDFEIVLTYDMLSAMGYFVDTSPHDSNYIDSLLNQKVQVSYEYNNSNLSNEYTLVGVIYGSLSKGWPVIFTQSQFDTIASNQYTEYQFSETDMLTATAFLSDNNRDNAKFIENVNKLNYHHETQYSSMLYMLEEMTTQSRKILLIIGGVFAVFTTFMIFTFISSSIAAKQKQIGTLRAIGARGIDVSKIFITEGLIIAMFSSIIANIGTAVVINLINNSIVEQYNVKLVLLYVNLISIMIVFALSVVVIVIATFLPLKRITLMKPIKAIKNN